MELEAIGTETVAIATELRKELNLKDSDSVAEFLNKRLAELEERRKAEEYERTHGPNESGWGILPDLILEKIFSYLSFQERYYASCTCSHWNEAFHMQQIWSDLVMNDTTLTRRKFDYGERSWTHMLDHHRTQQLISHVGQYLRRLRIAPKSFPGLFAHYHFMNHISSYSERHETNPEASNSCLFKIRNLRFEFFCDIITRDEHYVYGTGGDILKSLKRMMGNLRYLEHLSLIDLHLVPEDAIHLLDEACDSLCEQLKTLTLINTTKDHFALLHPGCFVNLRVLRMSPQNLGEEMIEMLMNSQSLQELHIIQNSYTGNAEPVPAKSWYRVNHLFKVFLRTATVIDKEIVWQERANVVSVLYDCPYTKYSLSSALMVVDLYSESLHEFGHFGMPKFSSSRRFVNRIDSSLLTLCRRCPYLTTLFVRDRISTSTALLIASMSPNLKYFYVRRKGLLKKIDFMFHLDLYLDYNFSQWIKLNAKDYDKTTREIAKILGIDWKPLSDKEFKAASKHWVAY